MLGKGYSAASRCGKNGHASERLDSPQSGCCGISIDTKHPGLFTLRDRGNQPAHGIALSRRRWRRDLPLNPRARVLEVPVLRAACSRQFCPRQPLDPGVPDHGAPDPGALDLGAVPLLHYQLASKRRQQ